MRLQVQSLALLRWLRICIALSCGIDRSRGSDPAWLWLWCRSAATALIQPLAWEFPCASNAALKSKKKKKKKKARQTLGLWQNQASELTPAIVSLQTSLWEKMIPCCQATVGCVL